jgi:hypothetical protein
VSEYLPVPVRASGQGRLVVNGSGEIDRRPSWFTSPIARAALNLAPEVLKLLGRRPQLRETRLVPGAFTGATGVTLSEVEMDLRIPFVRRVVVRRASSWAVAPEVLLAQPAPRRSRLGVGILSVAAVAIAGVFAVRRSGHLARIPAQAQRMLSQRPGVDPDLSSTD